jgi:hypothetical protein
MSMLRWVVAVLFVYMPPAWAEKSDFSSCDGYGAPSSSGDGLTKAANTFFIFVPGPENGNMRAGKTHFGESGVLACDRALADQSLLPRYWIRKVNLLRARAIHRISSSDFTGALLDLDAANIAADGKSDFFYERSLGLSIKFFRALAFLLSGNSEKAVNLANEVAAARPYNREVTLKTALLKLHATNNWEQYRKDLHQGSRIHPTFLLPLIYAEWNEAQFNEVASLVSQTKLFPPTSDSIYYVDFNDRDKAELINAEIELNLINAFALAATGRRAEATQRIAKVRVDIAEKTREPDKRSDGRPAKKDDFSRHLIFKNTLNKSILLLTETERLIALLDIAQKGDDKLLLKEIENSPLPSDSPGDEILSVLSKNNPPLKPEIDRIIATRQKARFSAQKMDRLWPNDVYSAFPEAETRSRLPRYKSATSIIGEAIANGYSVKKIEGSDLWRIRFGGLSASAAIVEEMALLRAADLAKAAGKSGIIIISTHTYARTMTTYTYGMGREDPNGYSAEIIAAFVDPEKLPGDLRTSKERVLSVEKIYTDLAPIYLSKD